MGFLAALTRHANTRMQRAAQQQLRTAAPETHNGGVCRRCGCDWLSCREWGCTPPDSEPMSPDRLRTSDPGMTSYRTNYEQAGS